MPKNKNMTIGGKSKLAFVFIILFVLCAASFGLAEGLLLREHGTVFEDPDGEKDASGGKYVGNLYEPGIRFNWYITSDRDVDDVVLHARLANGLDVDITGFDGAAFQVSIGVPTGEGLMLNPGDQAVVTWQGGPYTLPRNGNFADYLITRALPLKKGMNILSFEIMANDLAAGVPDIECFGPLFDCIKIITYANISFGKEPPATEGLEFELFDDGYGWSYRVSRYNGTDTVVYIPREHEGIPVVAIGGIAFYRRNHVTKVVIPDSVLIIHASAFYQCSNLTSVNIPDSVVIISSDVFADCISLKNITIGNGVRLIGVYAFAGSGLESVVIPDSVEMLGGYAFSGCGSLESAILPSGITTIGTGIFRDCYRLVIYAKAASQPASWSANWNNASYSYNPPVYWGCNISDIAKIDGAWYTLQDGNAILTKYAGDAPWFNVPQMVVIGDISRNVTAIGENAFRACSGLTSVVIPTGVTSIGRYAFYECSGLRSLVVSAGIENIGDFAFALCGSLTTVFYGGADESAWNSITKGISNARLLNATRYYYSATSPDGAGNYWHYDTDSVTPVIWE